MGKKLGTNKSNDHAHLIFKNNNKKQDKSHKEHKRYVIRGSIKARLIVTYLLFAVVPLLVVNLFSTSKSIKALRSTSSKLSSEMIKQTTTNINYVTNEIQTTMSKFIVNNLSSTSENLINDYMIAKTITEKSSAINEIRKQLDTVGTLDARIDSVAIICNDDVVIRKVLQMTEAEMLAFKEVEIPNKEVWIKGMGKFDQIFYVRKITNSITGQEFGILVAAISFKDVEADLSAIQPFENENTFIIDSEGKVICSSNPEITEASETVKAVVLNGETEGSQLKSGSLIAYTTTNNGWKIVSQIPEKALIKDIRQVTNLVWMIVFIIAILAVGVGIFVAKSFTTSIINMVRGMRRAETGDLTVQVPVKGKDEIGLLCASFNNMIKNIRSLLEETKEAIDYTLQEGKILEGSTQQSADAFEQLAIAIVDISEGSSYQAEDAQKGSAVMEELAGSIQEIMEDTQSIYTKNQDTKQIIEKANDSVELLNTTMSSVIGVTSEIAKSITGLSSLTKSIEQIMKFVDDISEETNLLALNASIEAARAGEVGKGFGVVAQQVKNLSDQSKASTRNVRLTLNEIESKTKEAVELVRKSNEIFEQQNEAVKGANEGFNHIISRFIDMDNELSDVNDKVSSIEILKNEMTGRIEDITSVTEQNASATQEVNALSEQQKATVEQLAGLANKLTSTMDKLNLTVDRFKVK